MGGYYYYYYLTDNIDCELGLSNGTQGIFRELVYDDKEHLVTFNMINTIFPSNSIYVRKPLYALVEMSSSQVETNLDNLQPKLILMTLVKKEYSISMKQLLGPLLEQRSGRKARLPILRPFDMKVLQIRPSPAQNAELARLDKLHSKRQKQCAPFSFSSFVDK